MNKLKRQLRDIKLKNEQSKLARKSQILLINDKFNNAIHNNINNLIEILNNSINENLYEISNIYVIIKQILQNIEEIIRNTEFDITSWSSINWYSQPGLNSYLNDDILTFNIPTINIDNSINHTIINESHNVNETIDIIRILYRHKYKILIKFITSILHLIASTVYYTKGNNSYLISCDDINDIKIILTKNHITDKNTSVDKYITFIETYLMRFDINDDNISDNTISKILNDQMVFNTNVETCDINNLFGETLFNVTRLLDTNYDSKNLKNQCMSLFKNQTEIYNKLAIIALIYFRLYDKQRAICYLLTALIYWIRKQSKEYNNITRFIYCNHGTYYKMSLMDIQLVLFDSYMYDYYQLNIE
jgi:hypothetical protein